MSIVRTIICRLLAAATIAVAIGIARHAGAQGIPIGALPSATLPLSGSEYTILSQNGTTVKATLSQAVASGFIIPNNTVLGNVSGSSHAAVSVTASQLIALLGLGTSAFVNTGTSGHVIPFLDGANTWSATQIFSVPIAGSNIVPLASLAQIGTNSILANTTSGTANVTAVSVSGCSGATSALNWTTNTGPGCNSSINAATLNGATFAAPGTIGGGTPSPATFTALTANTSLVLNGSSAVTSLLGNGTVIPTTNLAGAFTNGDLISFQSSTGKFIDSGVNIVAPCCVNTLNFGTTGLTPTGNQTGALTVSGTLVVANGGTGATGGLATSQNLSLPYVVSQSNTHVAHTGDTTETLLGSCQIPANAMGANGSIRISGAASRVSGTAGSITFRSRFGTANDLTGTQLGLASLVTGQASMTIIQTISNRNSTSSQVAPLSLNGGFQATTPPVSAINTTGITFIVFSGANGNAGDTFGLESLICEILPAGGN